MRYLVTQEIKSETKVMKKIYLFDFFFMIIYMSVSLVLGNLVHPSLQILFYIFSGIVALTLTGKSYYNKKRRNYEALRYFFSGIGRSIIRFLTSAKSRKRKQRKA